MTRLRVARMSKDQIIVETDDGSPLFDMMNSLPPDGDTIILSVKPVRSARITFEHEKGKTGILGVTVG